MLKIRDLVKTYKGKRGEKLGINGINLTVNHGEVVVLMGPSGCGKSTLMQCINRLIEPDSGEVIFNDIQITALNHLEILDIRKKIGYVFQAFNLIDRFTVLDNVKLAFLGSGIGEELSIIRAKKVLDKVGLSKKLEHVPSELSGGECQRVGLARAMVAQPELMLWDEPTASLDPILVKEVLDCMEEFVDPQKKIIPKKLLSDMSIEYDYKDNIEPTVLIVTHEVSFARRIADRIVLIENGKIVEEGSPEKVFTSPVSELGCKYRELTA